MIYVTHDQTEAMTMGDRIVIMKDGIIHQIDTPLNLYNHPVNKFVAGFIGSPSMNFIEGKLVQENGLTFKSKGNFLTLKLNESLSEGLKNYLSKSLWLGIRPEDIYDTDSSTRNNSAKIEVLLEVVEPMGNEIFLYFTIESSQFVARIPAREKPEPNTKRKLSFDLEKLHFFDADSEKSV
jgi:multiple sugar transport system ATP-binding protein